MPGLSDIYNLQFNTGAVCRGWWLKLW